jgi:hypothetical protein
VQLADKLRSQGLSYLGHTPVALPEAMFWNTYRMVDLSGRQEAHATMAEAGYGTRLADVSLVAWYLLALLAIAGALARKARRVPWAVIAIPGLLWLVTVPFLGTERLREPIEPFLIMLAAAGIVALLERRGPPAVTTASPAEPDLASGHSEGIMASEAPLVG